LIDNIKTNTFMHTFNKPLEMSFGESPIEPTTPTEVVADTMYRTFWYAQGAENLDGAFTALAAHWYAQHWTDAEWQAARRHVGDMEDDAFLRLGLPRKHVDPRPRSAKDETYTYGGAIREEFERRWRAAGYNFSAGQADTARWAESKLEGNLAVAETGMMYRDYYYNTGQRQRRFSTQGDAHESMYRTFVLERQPTGSEVFDAIFDELRQRFIEKGPPKPQKTQEGKEVGYADMVAAWQTNHPNEQYEPDDHELRLGLRRGEIRALSDQLALVSSLPLNGLVTTTLANLGRRHPPGPDGHKAGERVRTR
jgi:hypothetical protein